MNRTQIFALTVMTLGTGLSSVHAGIITGTLGGSYQPALVGGVTPASLTQSVSKVKKPAAAPASFGAASFVQTSPSSWTYVSPAETAGTSFTSFGPSSLGSGVEAPSLTTSTVHHLALVAPVPEPASLSVLALGAVCLIRRRR